MRRHTSTGRLDPTFAGMIRRIIQIPPNKPVDESRVMQILHGKRDLDRTYLVKSGVYPSRNI